MAIFKQPKETLWNIGGCSQKLGSGGKKKIMFLVLQGRSTHREKHHG
jgi:hypothetical protein